jgi:hypothetical protein
MYTVSTTSGTRTLKHIDVGIMDIMYYTCEHGLSPQPIPDLNGQVRQSIMKCIIDYG